MEKNATGCGCGCRVRGFGEIVFFLNSLNFPQCYHSEIFFKLKNNCSVYLWEVISQQGLMYEDLGIRLVSTHGL